MRRLFYFVYFKQNKSIELNIVPGPHKQEARGISAKMVTNGIRTHVRNNQKRTLEIAATSIQSTF